MQLLRKFWLEEKPDLVVSLIPNFSRSLFQSMRAEIPSTPLVTVLTDMADYPPHFWIEKQDQYFICGTPRAVEQARELGQPRWKGVVDIGNDPESAVLRAGRSRPRPRLASIPVCPRGSCFSAERAPA